MLERMNTVIASHDVSIRAGAVPEDVEHCADLWVRALQARDGAVDDAVMRQRVRDAFLAPIVRFAVATAPRAGFSLVEAIPADPAAALLHYLAVDPGGSGRGVGRALLEDAAQRTREAGFTSLILEVRTANDRAISLYTGFGFVPIGSPTPHPTAGYPMQTYALRLA